MSFHNSCLKSLKSLSRRVLVNLVYKFLRVRREISEQQKVRLDEKKKKQKKEKTNKKAQEDLF